MSLIYNKDDAKETRIPNRTCVSTPKTKEFTEAYTSNTQHITNNKDTPLEFRTMANHDIKGLEPLENNSLFTNKTKETMILLVTASASVICEEKADINCFSIWLNKSTCRKCYLQSSIPTASPDLSIIATCTSGVIKLEPEEAFSLFIYINGNEDNYSTGSNKTNLVNILTIYRLA